MKTFQLGAMYWLDPNADSRRIEEDMHRIRDNHFSIIRTFIWWEKVESKPGVFDFRPQDRLYEAADKAGIRIMETLGLYLPKWLKQENFKKGIDESARRYACFDRPEVMEPMRQFVETTVRRYRHAPGLAIWNLWNEAGKTPCKCPHTLAKFARWLKDRYPTLDNLHDAWAGEYNVFSTYLPDSLEEINAPWLEDMFHYGSRGRCTSMEADYLEFVCDNLDDNLRWLRDLVRAIDPAHETHSNPNSPFANEISQGQNEWQMARSLDSISVSVHPSHFFYAVEKEASFPSAFSFCADQVRGWAGGKDAWIGELQAGTTYHKLNKYTPGPNDISHYLYHSIGRGLHGVIFWEWQSWRAGIFEVGEFGLRRCHDGGPTPRSEAAAEFGRMIQEHAEDFSQADFPAPKAAILHSMTSNRLKYLQRAAQPHAGPIDLEHNLATYGCYKALNRANIAVDFITEAQFPDGILDNYKILFLPHVEMLDAVSASYLMDFVRNGGTLWADGRCAFLDNHAFLRHMIPGHGLDEAFGAREADFIAIRADDHEPIAMDDGTALQPYRHLQTLSTAGGSSVGRCQGQTVVVRHAYGRGHAEIVGSYLTLGIQHNPDPATMDYLANVARAAGVDPKLDMTPATGVEASVLRGPRTDIIILTNHTGAAVTAILHEAYRDVSASGPEGRTVERASDAIRCPLGVFETVALFCCR